jgi:hypothetical protein
MSGAPIIVELFMGRPTISPDQMLSHPMRRAVLLHLVDAGGQACSVSICAALQIRHRESLAWMARLLARADLIRVRQTGSGSARKAFLVITDQGRAAIMAITRAGPVNFHTQMLELSS